MKILMLLIFIVFCYIITIISIEDFSIINSGRIVGNNSVMDGCGSLINISEHKYKRINTITQIKELKSMKTYLLLPNNISNSYHKSKKYKRYEKVLNLIQELPKYNENIFKLNDKKINKFILLAKEKTLDDEPITPQNYNYKLSNQIISIMENNSTLSFKGEGPFLATTMINIITDKNITYLYIDLSEFNNSAIDEIINSYKQHLIDKGNSDFTILEKLKYKILALLTNANDNIHIVKSAVAGGIE